MKKFFTKNLKNKLVTLAVCAALYVALILISEFTPLRRTYLFGWTSDHLYLYTWAVAAVLIVFNCLPAALIISAGNFAGVFLGHFIGIPLEEQVYAKITPDMTPDQVGYILETNYQFPIWFLTVLVCVVLGIRINAVVAAFAWNKRKPQTENN